VINRRAGLKGRERWGAESTVRLVLSAVQLPIELKRGTITHEEPNQPSRRKEACMGIVIRAVLWNPIFGRTIRHHVSSR